MVLIKSISGVRGTIDNNDIGGLSSIAIKDSVEQYTFWIKNEYNLENNFIVIGRDGRVSGKKILSIVSSVLINLNINVVNLDLTTTPSVQMAVISENCIGGIMVSASHNPINWNGLKFLNKEGEFLTKKQSDSLYSIEKKIFKNLKEISLNSSENNLDYSEIHISSILKLTDIKIDFIKKRKFKIVVDGINSSGGIYVPLLLEKLGVDVIKLNCIPDGNFAHNPEPLPKNLSELSKLVVSEKADLGIAVDPDVDRLVFVCEDGSFFGEEYTIVAIANYLLSYKKGNTVCNLSSSNALKDITILNGGNHFYSPVGEANVVSLMKEKKAIFGGEGSGGVIFPDLHYGRDALVGIALFLSYLSLESIKISELKDRLPKYYMLKEKITVSKDFNLDYFNSKCQYFFNDISNIIFIDGVRINFNCNSWVHIRKSNTEPIIRIISESSSEEKANNFIKDVIKNLKNI